MVKYPISALLRLLPALLWLVASVISAVSFLEFYRASGTDGSDSTVLDRLFPFAFLLVAMYALWSAYKAFDEAMPALRADEPIKLQPPRRPRSEWTPTRYSLSEPLQAKLREAVEVLAVAGVLSRSEADEASQCTDADDEYTEITFYEVMHILRELRSRRGSPFANLAFFEDQVEVFESDIVAMVAELARLAGKRGAMKDVAVRSITGGPVSPAPRGAFPPPNAKVEFELHGVRHAMPFVMYGKNLPGGLFDGLADLYTRDGQTRRFISGYPDFLVIMLLERERFAALDEYFPKELEQVGTSAQ